MEENQQVPQDTSKDRAGPTFAAPTTKPRFVRCRVCIIVAKDDEHDGVIKMLEQRGTKLQLETPENTYSYQRGILVLDEKDGIDLLLFQLQRTGESEAFTKDVLRSYRPDWIFMTGVCAGRKGEVEQGSIIVAESVFHIDNDGKRYIDKEESNAKGFSLKEFVVGQAKLFNSQLRREVIKLETDTKIPEQEGLSAEKRKPQAILAPIVSSSSVRKDMEIQWPRIVPVVRDVAGLEMEVYGLYKAAGNSSCNVVAIKAVQDFGDKDKDDKYRKYGCEVSAAWVLEFLRYIKPKPTPPVLSLHQQIIFQIGFLALVVMMGAVCWNHFIIYFISFMCGFVVLQRKPRNLSPPGKQLVLLVIVILLLVRNQWDFGLPYATVLHCILTNLFFLLPSIIGVDSKT